MRRRFSGDVDLIERKPVHMLAFLRDDNWLDPPKSRDLPINVQHLRLEKRRTVEGDDRFWIRRVVQCLKSNIEQQNQKLIVKSLIPFHLPVSGSRTTLSSAFPYCAGAFGFSI